MSPFIITAIAAAAPYFMFAGGLAVLAHEATLPWRNP